MSAFCPHRVALRMLSLFVVLAGASRLAAQPAPVEDGRSLVQVIATHQSYDPQLPWQKRQPATRSGYAVVVGDGLVLTTEYLVRNTTLVELYAPMAGDSIPAVVLAADEQVNLALLRLSRPGDAQRFTAIAPIDRAINRDDDLTVVQLDDSRGIQAGQATVLQATVDSLPWSSHASLMLNILTEQAVGGEGAPVLVEGQLAGLILRYDAARRTGSMLPARVIARFLDDAANPPYTGFAAAGFTWRQLVDPYKRAWLKLDGKRGGILVLSTIPGSGAHSALQPDDVVLAWDGFAVDEMGFYDDPDYGRLMMPHLIKGRRRPGDRVPVEVVRDGQTIGIDITLERMGEDTMLIPDNTLDEREAYLVEGGLVVRELTGRYLRSYGAKWEHEIDSSIVRLYATKRYFPERPGQRVVILSGVLPHPINIGYQHFQNLVVTHVNRQPVDNLRDVFRIRRKDGVVNRLTLKSIGVDLVLDAAAIPEANMAIQRLYNIPALTWGGPAQEREDEAQ